MYYNLCLSGFFAVVSFAYYKFHKFWLKNNKNELFVKESQRLDKVKHWGIILVCAACSIIYFLKFITINL